MRRVYCERWDLLFDCLSSTCPDSLTPQPSDACNQTLMAALLVEEGAGIAIVDPWISRNHFPGLLFKPFRPAINMSCIALHSQSQPMSRLATGFLDVVKEDINFSRNELSPITSLD